MEAGRVESVFWFIYSLLAQANTIITVSFSLKIEFIDAQKHLQLKN